MSLHPEWRVGALSLTEAPFLVPFGGVDYGNGENVTQVLQSLLQDGDIELSSRTGNRTVVLPVLIEATDMAALAEAEAALVAECDKPLNEVYVDPGDGYGAPFIFDVFRGQMVFSRDDDWEQQGYRSYTLTFRALPFSRSVSETVTAALPASGTTTTLVNNGSSTTGWTGAANGATASPTVASGAIKVTNGAAVQGLVRIDATLTTAISTSATPYLAVDWKPESPAGSPTIEAYGDGTFLPKLAEATSPTAGYTRTWFGPVDASSIAALKLSSFSYVGSLGSDAPATRSLYVDNINRTDVAPSLGTGRQLLRRVSVGGSARADASVAVEHASSSLGDVLVYVYPDSEAQGYQPSLRQYLVAGPGTVTPDTSMVSGARQDISADPALFGIPLNRIVPGRHLLVVRASTTGVGDGLIVVTSATNVGGNQVGDAETRSFSIGNPSVQTIYAAMRLNLPTHDVSETVANGFQYIVLDAAAATVTALVLDEAWLFNLDIGRLVGPIACGTGAAASGGPASRLFIEPATVQRTRPTVRIGYASDRSDSFHPPSLSGWQFPEFVPPSVNVFTVTTNALDASVDLRQFDRWHTHAGS